MAGHITSRSIQLWAMVASHRVRVLIDTGASHNFICPKVVQAAGLEISHTADFVVTVGNGEQVMSSGKCTGVQVQFPNLMVSQDFYVFPLEGSEVVLGLAWLDTLGDVVANFKESRLVISDSHEGIVLQGDPELCYGEVALRSALKVLQEGGQGYMVQLWPKQGQEGADQVIPPEIQHVMESNEEISNLWQAFPHIEAMTMRSLCMPELAYPT